MPFSATNINDLLLFEPRLFEDERGYFYESFSQKEFEQATQVNLPFIQDNHSFSKYGVLRGLHFQKPPFEQAKLIKVVAGEIFDVAVDLRPHSPTYGKWEGFILSAENKKQLYIPRGFAHGFVVLSASAEVLYKCDNYYAPQAEGGILYNDPQLCIDWKIDSKDIMISSKDAKLPLFEQK
ncbi:MAG: dTDP-4-dehydrorhamnose 3,5-epimerase [Thermonemataceae bacterium]|nr:dTDP-4-dehydrorhamnose 3,5-epimerase [Thermonemataceae bacterium]